MKPISLIITCCLFSSLWTRQASAVTSEPLSPEDAILVRTFPLQAPICLSPDGVWVAYTLQQRARAHTTTHGLEYFSPTGITWLADGAEVWVANVKTHEQLQVSDPKSNSWSPMWSPSGKTLAFYSDRGGLAQLWVWDLSERTAHVVSEIQIRSFALTEVPRWSPDGRFIFAKVASLSEGTSTELKRGRNAALTDPVVFVSEPVAAAADPQTDSPSLHEKPTFMEGYRGDLARFDLATGKVEALAREKDIVGWWPSPDGRFLAFTEIDGIEKGNADLQTYTIWAIDLENKAFHAMARRVPLVIAGLAVAWSPDGRRVAYIVGGDPNYSSPLVDCYTVDPRSDAPSERITSTVRPESADVFRPPRWTHDGKTLLLMDAEGVYIFDLSGRRPRVVHPGEGRTFTEFLSSNSHGQLWSDDGLAFYAFEQDKATLDVEVHRVSLVDGSDVGLSREAIALPTYPILQTDATEDGTTVVYLSQSSDRPLDIWAASRGFEHYERVTTTNPQLSQRKLGRSKLVSWNSLDGEKLRGAMLLPPDFQEGKSYPVVVEVYGGELRSQFLNVFGLYVDGGPLNQQLLATRGIVVFFPDAPMGTVTPTLDLLKTVLPGVNKLVDLGIAQKNAIGLMGESYGGYSALSLLTQTPRFKAAVAVAPMTDLFDVYGDMDDNGVDIWIEWAEQSQGRMQGTPWQYRGRYIENSPFFFADRINTPILLVHGGADEGAQNGCRKMFVALKRLGKTAEYIRYPGGRHMPEYWLREQQVDFDRRMIEWFHRYLQ